MENFINYQDNNFINFTPFMKTIEAYYANIPDNLLKIISEILKSHFDSEEQSKQRQQNEQLIINIQQILKDTMSNEYTNLCISKIFDLVLNYPDSHPIILELSQTIKPGYQQHEMADIIQAQYNKRLLIPGIITQNILNFYISSLKIMQILDSKGITFEKVTGPIKQYLLNRNDTIRCIISHLTDSEEGQGYGQLIKQRVSIPETAQQQQLDLSSDEDEQQAEKWEIQSLKHKKNELIRIKYMESDLLSILVNLYGSQEAFINEYQNMLAEKLIGPKSVNIDEEFKNLELLKLRCGDQSLQACNIILKDVRDSKKIDQNIQQDFKNNVMQEERPECSILQFEQLHCQFVSKGYWQINYDQEELELPDKLQAVFDSYCKHYEIVKQQRKLQLHTNLGYVNLTLSFDNGDFEFKCPPAQAILISFFDEDQYDIKNGVSAQWLSEQSKIPLNILKQKMSFWVHNCVVKEKKIINPKKPSTHNMYYQDEQDSHTIMYQAVDTYERHSHEDNIITCDEEENELILRDQSTLGYESQYFNKILEDLLISLLKRIGPKTPDQIFKLFKTLYSPDIGIGMMLQKSQVVDILKNLVSQQKVYFNGEQFGLVNN